MAGAPSRTTVAPPTPTGILTLFSLSVPLPLFVLKPEFKNQGEKGLCFQNEISVCLLYTSDAADDWLVV